MTITLSRTRDALEQVERLPDAHITTLVTSLRKTCIQRGADLCLVLFSSPWTRESNGCPRRIDVFLPNCSRVERNDEEIHSRQSSPVQRHQRHWRRLHTARMQKVEKSLCVRGGEGWREGSRLTIAICYS